MRRVVLIAFVLMSCSSPAKKTGKPSKLTSDEGETPRAVKYIGSSCKLDSQNIRSDCPPNTLCAPAPGGLCTAFCYDTACPDGSVCVDSPRMGQACMQRCSSDSDCRRSEGYVCDPGWSACVLPGLSAPKPPQCEGQAELPRKTFVKVTQLSTPGGPGMYHFEPAAALARNGDLTTVYITNSAMDFKQPVIENVLGVSTIDRKGKVDGDRAIKTDRQNHYDPWMASDRKGTMYAVWMGFDGGRAPERNMQIAMATSKDGVVWSQPVPAWDADSDCPDSAPGCVDKPMIAIGPDKNKLRQDAIHVFYFSEPGGGLKMTRSTDGGKTFGKSVLVGESAYGDAEVSSDGDIHVVIASADPRTAGLGDPKGKILYTRSSDAGASFSQPVQVSDPGQPIPFFFSNPQVVKDTKRKRLYVVYPTGTPDGTWDIVLATSSNEGKDWTRTKVNDDESCANHMIPAMALDPKTGALHLMWTENRGGAGRIAYARCDSGGALCSANESVSDAPFASYGFVRHAPTWLGEYNSLLIDDQRRTIHAVWTQTVDEDGSKRSRIFHASGKLR
jgi:hypothetical protein